MRLAQAGTIAMLAEELNNGSRPAPGPKNGTEGRRRVKHVGLPAGIALVAAFAFPAQAKAGLYKIAGQLK